MGFTRQQTWQIVNQKPLTVLETTTREPLSNLNELLDNRLDYPFRIAIDDTLNVITIKGSELQSLKSDGVGGTTESFKISASATAGQYAPIPDCTLNLDDGILSYLYDSGTETVSLVSPPHAVDDYVWMGLELKIDGKYHAIFGTSSSDENLTTYPLFTGEAVLLVLLKRKADGGTVSWDFIKPSTADFVHFKSAKVPKISEDGVTKVKIVDLVSTSLPTGAVTLDNTSILESDVVLFTQATVEGIYRAVGTGSTITGWDKMFAPANGTNVQITNGTTYLRTIWKKVSNIWSPIEISDAVKDPSGFPNRIDSTISFVDATRTFTIEPSGSSSIPGAFDYFVKGIIYRSNSIKTAVLTNTVGIHYVYFNGATLTAVSALTSAQYETLLTEGALVAQIYWDGTKGAIVGDERHGITMDGATHKYLHMSNGAVLQSGLTIGGYTTSGTGSSNADAQITLSQGRMFDEDIDFIIDDSTSSVANVIHKQILNSAPAQIPMFYRTGASGTWAKVAASSCPILQNGSNTMEWNQYSAGSWSTAPASSGNFVTSWVFATNSIVDPIISVVGQKQYSTLSEAQEEETFSSLALGDFPSTEFKLLYRLIYQTNSSYTNSVKTRLIHVQDLRIAPDSPFTSVSLHDHGLLTGLNDPDHAPTAVTTSGVALDGGFSASDIDVKEALGTLNNLFGQMRLKRHPTITSRVSITGASRTLNNGTKIGQAIGLLLLQFDGAQVDFATGQIFAADGITSLGINFTPSTIPSSSYQYYSITVVANALTAENMLTAQVLVVPASSSNAVLANAPLSAFAPGIKLGQVVVRSSGAAPGSINAINQSDIIQLGVGSGGGSDGSGDASELLERLKNRFDNSTYLLMTPNIFSMTGTTETDAVSTADYSVVSASYEFPTVGATYQSINSLDPFFLTEGQVSDIERVELECFYNLSNVDTAATFQVSRNGGSAWQTVVLSRIGQSDTFTGVHSFTNEVTDSYTQTVGAAFAAVVDFTDLNSHSRLFTIPSATTIKKITATISVSGAPVGYVFAKIVKDIAGSPSTDPNHVYASSSNKFLTGAVSGSVVFTITAPLAAGSYHVVFETDSAYKVGYTANNANKISINRDAGGATNIIYSLGGRVLNLIVKIVGGTAGAVLRGYGIMYKLKSAGVSIDSGLYQHNVTFNGITENLSTFTIPFFPDPKYLKVYEIQTGQVYLNGAYTISGQNVIFPTSTFSKPGTIQLLFEQYKK